MANLPTLPPPDPKPIKPDEVVGVTYEPKSDEDSEITWDDVDNILESTTAIINIVKKSNEADEEDDD